MISSPNVTQYFIKFQSTQAFDEVETIKVSMNHGLPKFHIPLPSRKEVCIFTVKPLQNTVRDLTNSILMEDRGIDRVVFKTLDNERIAQSNSIDSLLEEKFSLVINEQTFSVDSSIFFKCKKNDELNDSLDETKSLVSQLYSTLNVDAYLRDRELELQKRIEAIQEELVPLEKKREDLAVVAARKTKFLTWAGLGAMGFQFGLLARLTWWEYSWDIMEPVTYFVGYGTAMAAFAYYVVTRQEYCFPQVFDRQYLKYFYKAANKKKFDVEKYNQLCDEAAILRSDLDRIRDPLLLKTPLQQIDKMIPERVEEILQRREDNLPKP